MLSTNLILRIYLTLFVVILGLSLFRCRINGAPITCQYGIQIGERTDMNAEDVARIEQAIKMKLMMLNTRENHTTIEFVRVHSMTVRLTVGLMYESSVDIKLNESVLRCDVELWTMPFLTANKFQMKCDDDKQHEYHLIDGGLRLMNASETVDFGERLAHTMGAHLHPAGALVVNRVIVAQRVAVNGFIDLASIELQRPTSANETIKCAVEAWGTSSSFRDLNVACKSTIYRIISSRQMPNTQPCN